MNGETMRQEHYDVAIVGGGPAGLQAALILARTRKRLIIFDAPEPPRNGASHGVHNFVGVGWLATGRDSKAGMGTDLSIQEC